MASEHSLQLLAQTASIANDILLDLENMQFTLCRHSREIRDRIRIARNNLELVQSLREEDPDWIKPDVPSRGRWLFIGMALATCARSAARAIYDRVLVSNSCPAQEA